MSGISAPVRTIPVDAGVSADVILTLERAIRERAECSAEWPDYATFAAAQLDLSSSFTAQASSRSEIVVTDGSTESVRGFFDMVCQLLELSLSFDDERGSELTRTMIVATPQLRAQILFGASRTGLGAQTQSTLMRLPYLLQGLFIFALAARSAGMNSITLQTLSHLSRSSITLLQMISRANRPLIWKPGTIIPLSIRGPREFQRPYLRIAKALLPGAQQRHKRTMAELLMGSCSLHGTQRVQFLTELSSLLAERTVGVSGDTIGQPRLLRRVRCAVQRAALAVTNEDSLAAFAAKQGLFGGGAPSQLPPELGA